MNSKNFGKAFHNSVSDTESAGWVILKILGVGNVTVLTVFKAKAQN